MDHEKKNVYFHLTEQETEIVEKVIDRNRNGIKMQEENDLAEMCRELINDIKTNDGRLASCIEYLDDADNDKFHYSLGCFASHFDMLVLKANKINDILKPQVKEDA